MKGVDTWTTHQCAWSAAAHPMASMIGIGCRGEFTYSPAMGALDTLTSSRADMPIRPYATRCVVGCPAPPILSVLWSIAGGCAGLDDGAAIAVRVALRWGEAGAGGGCVGAIDGVGGGD
jgi:hypothetical protein